MEGGPINVSVVVRTLNSERTIDDCLKSLFSQTYRDYEVLVIDDHSVDRTLQIAHKYRTRVFQNLPGKNPCNRGIEQATGEVIAFIDSDCVAPSTWLGRMVECFEDENVAVVGGEELAPPTSKYWPRCFEPLRRMEKRFLYHWGSVERIITCNVAYRRDALIEVGGFNDLLFGGEEVELGWRLSKRKCKVIFDPELVVLHNRRSSLARYFRQQFGLGLGNGRVVRMHPDYIKPSHIVTGALPSIAILLIALLVIGRTSLALYMTSILLTVAALTAMYLGFVANEVKLIPGIFISSLAFILARCSGFLIGLSVATSKRIAPCDQRQVQ